MNTTNTTRGIGSIQNPYHEALEAARISPDLIAIQMIPSDSPERHTLGGGKLLYSENGKLTLYLVQLHESILPEVKKFYAEFKAILEDPDAYDNILNIPESISSIPKQKLFINAMIADLACTDSIDDHRHKKFIKSIIQEYTWMLEDLESLETVEPIQGSTHDQVIQAAE
jgi:hypothetical protein